MSITFEPVESTVEEIPTAFGDRIALKLKALTKRLAKMGVPAPTIEFGPIIRVPFLLTADEERYHFETGIPVPTFPAWETVTVKGFEAKSGGWTGVAVLDWTVSPTEAFVARFPGHDDDEAPAISEELRTRGPLCDHCGTKRSRNNTIAFTHDDGRTIAVGTGCVLEYLGVDPRTILMLSDFVKSVDDDEEFGSMVKRSLDPFEFVALAAEITRIFGFAKSGSGLSTKDLTTSIGVTGLGDSRSDRELARELTEGGFDMERGRAKATAVAAWIAEDTSSDFLRSASIALNGNPVEAGARHAGILAALPFSHDRHIGVVAEREAKRAAEAEARKSGVFIGSIGDKLTVKGTVAFYNTYDGTYGTSVRLTIVTDDGNRVTTYGSGNTLFGWSSGDKVEMVGKIKDHDESDTYGKSTVLERVKVTELDEHGAPLPECSAARCHRPASSTLCHTCHKGVCANGHGRHYRDEFYCDSCLELLWDVEREREKLAKATLRAATTMLGGRPTYNYGYRLPAEALDILVPA